MNLSEYRMMWIYVMFDLPTDTKMARKSYSIFRKNLIKDGFTMVQYSVYERFCPSKENAEVHTRRVENFLPPDGEVRVLVVTDKQYEKMKVFWGKLSRQKPPAPKQLELF
ncbi:CRISPR-associated endoribonuclease Cas2 [Sedimentisphaera cyanobacteriorum]|uniref:CRISPR-associated endoribonuclease Cas2 n=1 Tax=Sedimentisphaera cyanobacteriorum TaxID=1940790 RepID=A0A1Q2HM44_9BACT|nr:CRISPR-associated endonuclease Cas2 [Sedimentisphaera cyanobacteriorum]AQQ08341.1 CRISPR-associated endoribonuclease Cas2 [Sedimentisphaera cyanobacteriorum]